MIERLVCWWRYCPLCWCRKARERRDRQGHCHACVTLMANGGTPQPVAVVVDLDADWMTPEERVDPASGRSEWPR